MTYTPSFWTRFWHEPVRAERLAVTRILLALALLTDLLFQYLPRFAEFYGPQGLAPPGVHDEWLLRNWYWPVLLFNTDNLAVVAPLFALRLAVTAALLVGWHTRLMAVLVWFLSYCFAARNPALNTYSEGVLMVGLFLLMLAPAGEAFSLDRLRRRRRGAVADPPMTPAWPVRLIQLQVCMIYLATGLAKLTLVFCRIEWQPDETWWDGVLRTFRESTWWNGTTLHYVLNDTTMGRWPYAKIPLPLWLTRPATYAAVWWETLFPLLVLSRWTRKWTLWFGVLFHFSIWMTIEVGWFGLYTLSLYGVWIPGEFWDRWLRRRAAPVAQSQLPQAAGRI
jgi:uncharacterized membrane protein YphA (DoxX/SURF4 family)